MIGRFFGQNLKEINSKEDSLYDLTVDKVSFAWPSGVKALENCSFSIPGPGLWMIVGSNGSGKSTLFRLISGIILPQTGKITCNLKTAMMFQNPDHQLLLPSCYSDLLLGVPTELTQLQKQERINSVLEQVGMDGMQERPIHTLSGGQKQRLALAGALAGNANLFLLDEPTALLDPISQESILRLIQDLCNRPKNPITALWITHRLEELSSCKAAALMERGKIGKWQNGNELFRRLN